MVHREEAICALRRSVLGRDWAMQQHQIEARSLLSRSFGSEFR
jgi:hypothetical protein